jgi:hypothetical protein
MTFQLALFFIVFNVVYIYMYERARHDTILLLKQLKANESINDVP